VISETAATSSDTINGIATILLFFSLIPLGLRLGLRLTLGSRLRFRLISRLGIRLGLGLGLVKEGKIDGKRDEKAERISVFENKAHTDAFQKRLIDDINCNKYGLNRLN
jgi:hypothetical protein